MSFSSRRRLLSSSLLAGVLGRIAPVSGLAGLSAAVSGTALADGSRVPDTSAAGKPPGGSRSPAPAPTGAGTSSRPPQGASSAAAPSAPDPKRMPMLTALPPLADAFALDFDVYYGNGSVRGLHVAQAVYRFRRQGGQYHLDTEAQATGVLAVFYSGTLQQSSSGTLGEQGFVPHRYTEKRGKRPQRQFEFDNTRRRIRLDGNDGAAYPFPAGTQDRLSIFFQLGLLARNGDPALQPGRQFVLPLAGSHRVDEPFFRVIGKVTLETNAGPFETLRIAAHKPGDPDAPRFDLWLAPSLKMLPVRIRVHEKSGGSAIVDQLLRRKPEGV